MYTRPSSLRAAREQTISYSPKSVEGAGRGPTRGSGGGGGLGHRGWVQGGSALRFVVFLQIGMLVRPPAVD